MSRPLHMAPRPCSTCPYRRDTPSGLWDASEYRKLALYDERPGETPETALFLCHQTSATGVETACRGWATVHADTVAVRLAQARGSLTPAQVRAEVDVDLYATGQEACDAGLADIEDPGDAAMAAQVRLLRSKAGRLDNETP